MSAARWIAVVTAAVLVPAAACAEDAGAALAKASRCHSCHDAVRVLIGPPYQAIALRYANDRQVMETVLARKILVGGGGNWGVVPMVPNEHVKPDDALLLARWVLDQRPK
jgi:cytochrome c551/c552